MLRSNQLSYFGLSGVSLGGMGWVVEHAGR